MGKQKPSEDDWEEDELHGWSGETTGNGKACGWPSKVRLHLVIIKVNVSCSTQDPLCSTELPPLHTDPCLGPPGEGLLSTTCSLPR